MSIAYLISAHTDPQQLRKLISALHPDAHFFVHVDKKSDFDAFTSCIQQENVHFITQRVDVIWGTIRQVDYQMALIKEAIEYPIPFDRIFFLSGLDYPLWSNARITSWLEANKEKEFMAGFCMGTGTIDACQQDLYTVPRPFVQIDGLSVRWNQRIRALLRRICKVLGIRKKLSFTAQGKTWQLYKGSDWWCISRPLLLHIYNIYRDTPEIRRYFVNSFAPSETLPQTIAYNFPEWRARGIVFTDTYPGFVALTPLHFVIYKGSIRVYDENDFQMLIDSGKMFVRKLQSGRSDSLITLLDRHRKEEEATFSTPSPH